MEKAIGKNSWFDRHDRTINRLALALIVAISILFLVTIYRFSFDGPYAYDDFNLFVESFSEKFLKADNIFDRIKYLFSPNNYPHTKFFGRLFSMVQYLATGSVNFKFLILVGALIVTSIPFVARHTTKFDFVLLVPLVFMLLLPERMNFWAGFVSGYAIVYVAGLLVFYWLSIGKFFAPVTLAFFTAFAQNPGMAIFIAAFPLFLLTPNKSWSRRGGWLAVFLFTLTAFWMMVSPIASEFEIHSESNISVLPQCLPSMLAHEGQFLSMPFFGGNELKRVMRNIPLLGLLFSVMVFGILSIGLWRQRKTYTPKNAMFLAFLLFGLSGSVLAALVTDECGSLNDNVSPRYMMWSIMAWVGIYLFLLQSASRKLQLLIAMVFAALFLPRFVSEYSNAEENFQERQYIWAQMGTMTNVPPKRARFVFENLDKSIEAGVYKPSFPESELSSYPQPVRANQLKDIWFDLVQNEHFCKVETIVKRDPNNVVEIWIGEDSNLKRVAPFETRPKLVKNFLEKGSRRISNLPKVNRNSVSYIFISDKVSECKNVRIRVGDKVSDYLQPIDY